MPDTETEAMPEWAHPDILGRLWSVDELADTLERLGWTPEMVDPFSTHVASVEHVDDDTGEVLYVEEEHDGQPLARYDAWVSPDRTESFRLPRDRHRLATPYNAACVVALLGKRSR